MDTLPEALVLRPHRRSIGSAPLAVALAAALAAAACTDPLPRQGDVPPSLLITGARVADGTGAPLREADVRVEDGVIAAVAVAGELPARPGERVIPADGLVLAPGFIDTHSHHAGGLQADPTALEAVSQGITTIVTGPDGGSPFPLSDFFEGLEAEPVALNVAAFSGHNTLRSRVMGDDFRRPATEAEVAEMRRLLAREMEAGALGLSTGLEYDPGIYSTAGEVVALAREAARFGGRYDSHMRSEDRDFWAALEELTAIGRETGIPVHVSHMKLAMKGLWGRAGEAVARMEAARAEGIEITADIYPYEYWQSTMTVLLPERDFTDRAAFEFALEELVPPEGFLVAAFAPEPSYVGLRLDSIARLRGTDPVTAYMQLVAEAEAWEGEDAGRVEAMIGTSMATEDIHTLLRWPHTHVASDGGLKGRHPRGAGTFPRVLGRYVRDDGVLDLPTAIHKMTGLPAATAGIRDRGLIQPGMAADLVLFDPLTILDRATPEDPTALSVGIHAVWVNGTEVFRDGAATGALPGRPLPGGRARARSALTPAQATAIDAVFREMDDPQLPGCAVGVVRDGALAFGRGYGMANLEHGIPLDTRSVFRMGSVGKQFTAGTVALLALDGVIDLDADVRTYLPELPDFGEPVTVRHLVHHTSGYRDYLTLVSLSGAREEDYYDDPELYRLLTRQEELNFPPGSDFLYSNSGYFLLGQLVLRVTGRSLAEVAAERIFRPLGMASTHYHDHWQRIVPNRATGYAPAEWYRPGEEGPRTRDDAWPGYVEGAWAGGRDPFAGSDWVVSTTTLPMIGDGGVFSSVEGMVPWVAGLLDPAAAPGGQAWHDLVRSRGVLTSGDTLDYAFGLGHGEQRGLRTLGHGGSFVGYRAGVQTWPETATGVVVLCNRADANPMALAERVGAVVLADEMGPPPEAPASGGGGGQGRGEGPAPPAADLSPAQRRALGGGFYSRELDTVWRIDEVDGALRLRAGEGMDLPLQASAPDRLFRRGLALRFQLDGSGAASGFRADAGRVRNLAFTRIEAAPPTGGAAPPGGAP
ncbi:MAG TPA: serine hydrolase [Longimicrobiales bacterium]|nr:serine hydrolase [Longimicrobiales bacterium]